MESLPSVEGFLRALGWVFILLIGVVATIAFFVGCDTGPFATSTCSFEDYVTGFAILFSGLATGALFLGFSKIIRLLEDIKKQKN